MNDFLKTILSLSFSGSLLVIFLTVCRPFFKDRVSKRWQYYIWLVVILRFLLPFAPPLNAVMILSQHFAHTAVISKEETIFPQQPFLEPTQEPQNSIEFIQESLPQEKGDFSIVSFLFKNLPLIWFIGVLILFIRKVTIYQSFIRYIKAGSTEVSDIEYLNSFSSLCEEAGIKKTVELYTNPMISSPMLTGFFKPCVVLPVLNTNKLEFCYIINHELTHCHRLDMFYKWLVQITICVHWFNPLVYKMEKEINRACELACDEGVIEKLDEEGKKAYGTTLLGALKIAGSYKDSIASVTLNENAQLLKERLGAIMRYQKRRTVWAVSATIILTLTICFSATALGAYTARPVGSNSNPKGGISIKTKEVEQIVSKVVYEKGTPQAALLTALNALKELDMDTFNQYTNNGDDKNNFSVMRGKLEGIEKEIAFELFSAIEYEIEEAKINGEKAVIPVKISNVNFKTVLPDVISSSIAAAFSDTATEEDPEQIMLDALRACDHSKKISYAMELTAQKKNGIWIIDIDNALFANAVMGGMAESGKEMENAGYSIEGSVTNFITNSITNSITDSVTDSIEKALQKSIEKTLQESMEKAFQ